MVFGRSPLVKGNVYELARKCGKPNCICTRGELHRSMVLTWSEKGKSRLLSIPLGAGWRGEEKERGVFAVSARPGAGHGDSSGDLGRAGSDRETSPRGALEMKESVATGSRRCFMSATMRMVIEAFRRGEFDYLEGVGEVSEVDFFRAITGKNILQ